VAFATELWASSGDDSTLNTSILDEEWKIEVGLSAGAVCVAGPTPTGQGAAAIFLFVKPRSMVR